MIHVQVKAVPEQMTVIVIEFDTRDNLLCTLPALLKTNRSVAIQDRTGKFVTITDELFGRDPVELAGKLLL
jgi:hypothetical protein